MTEPNLGTLVSVTQLQQLLPGVTALDCRFSLLDPEAGETDYRAGHIPGAHYLHLNRDLSSPVQAHGGRHPLPDPRAFCERLAELGVGRDSPVVAYCNSGFAFCARLWWMMCALGYTRVSVLDGGFAAWLEEGGEVQIAVPVPVPVAAHGADDYDACVDIEELRSAQGEGALLIDSREERRYRGLEESIDPVAGHIPGALNFPWQGVSDESGLALSTQAQRQRWQDIDPDMPLVVYCGSGVTACVNLLSLHLAGRDGARLYGGSWSDWCSWL